MYARLNFSHGTHRRPRLSVFDRLRRYRGVKICLSASCKIPGPKIRTGEIEDGRVRPDRRPDPDPHHPGGDSATTSGSRVDYQACLEACIPAGASCWTMATWSSSLRQSPGRRGPTTRVVLGGLLKPHKGVNLPGVQLDIPGFTHKDETDLNFGLELGVDAWRSRSCARGRCVPQCARRSTRHAPDAAACR